LTQIDGGDNTDGDACNFNIKFLDSANDGGLDISEVLFNAISASKSNLIEVVPNARTRYQYQARAIIPINNPPTIDCWVQWNLWYNYWYPSMLSWANYYCRPYRSCWCCNGGGLCIAFFVNFNNPRCYVIATQYTQNLAVRVFVGKIAEPPQEVNKNGTN
ncbi:unnamed protein product, partial [Didymodactylos carnosus]